MKLFASLPSLALAFALVASAASASAQPRAKPSTTVKTTDYTERVVDGDQVVKFTGDELVGIENGAFGMTVRRPPGSTRAGLIRPRLNFVPELLASVENL